MFFLLMYIQQHILFNLFICVLFEFMIGFTIHYDIIGDNRTNLLITHCRYDKIEPINPYLDH